MGRWTWNSPRRWVSRSGRLPRPPPPPRLRRVGLGRNGRPPLWARLPVRTRYDDDDDEGDGVLKSTSSRSSSSSLPSAFPFLPPAFLLSLLTAALHFGRSSAQGGAAAQLRPLCALPRDADHVRVLFVIIPPNALRSRFSVISPAPTSMHLFRVDAFRESVLLPRRLILSLSLSLGNGHSEPTGGRTNPNRGLWPFSAGLAHSGWSVLGSFGQRWLSLPSKSDLM